MPSNEIPAMPDPNSKPEKPKRAHADQVTNHIEKDTPASKEAPIRLKPILDKNHREPRNNRTPKLTLQPPIANTLPEPATSKNSWKDASLKEEGAPTSWTKIAIPLACVAVAILIGIVLWKLIQNDGNASTQPTPLDTNSGRILK